jgi:hypothetical protein
MVSTPTEAMHQLLRGSVDVDGCAAERRQFASWPRCPGGRAIGMLMPMSAQNT